MHGAVDDHLVVFEGAAGHKDPAIGQKGMAATEKIHHRAIWPLQCRRMIESLVVEYTLAGIPHDAGEDFLGNIPEIRGLKPEDVIA